MATEIGAIDIDRIGEEVALLEGMRTTRAIRRLRPDPVPAVLIRKVCEAGTFAPSGGNRQPWVFVAVTDRVRREWIAERYRAAFLPYIQPAVEAAKDPSYPEAKRRNMRAAILWPNAFTRCPSTCSSRGGRVAGSRNSKRCSRRSRTCSSPVARSASVRR